MSLPTAKQLSRPWSEVRQTLLTICGIIQSKYVKDIIDPNTAHCFADGTHIECCAPTNRSDYKNDNADGAAEGISRQNRLPITEYNGKWCTCVSGDVCRTQFHTPPKWTAVWVNNYLVIAVQGVPKRWGKPTGKRPSLRDRHASCTNYESLYPGFMAACSKVITNTHNRSKHLQTKRKKRSYPLCTAIDPDLKRNPQHPNADMTCLSPSGKSMRYPRKHSYRECKAYRRAGHKGFTVKSSCSAFF